MRQYETKLEDGKYTFYLTKSWIPKCDRYDEEWREFLGDNAIYSLIIEAHNGQQLDKWLQDNHLDIYQQFMESKHVK